MACEHVNPWMDKTTEIGDSEVYLCKCGAVLYMGETQIGGDGYDDRCCAVADVPCLIEVDDVPEAQEALDRVTEWARRTLKEERLLPQHEAARASLVVIKLDRLIGETT